MRKKGRMYWSGGVDGLLAIPKLFEHQSILFVLGHIQRCLSLHRSNHSGKKQVPSASIVILHKTRPCLVKDYYGGRWQIGRAHV